MATPSPSPASQKKKAGDFPHPPRRGQVKAQIFSGLVNSVVSTVSMARESLGKITGHGGNGADACASAGSSASSTPPPSSYNSEGNSDAP